MIAIGTASWTDRCGWRCACAVAARNVRCGYADVHRSDDDGDDGERRGDGSMRSARCSGMNGAADDDGSVAEAAAIPNPMNANCAFSSPESSDHSCCCCWC